MCRRYWFIYHKKDPKNFYAYTDDKKLLKIFKEQRDVKQFYFVDHWLNQKEISDLAKRYKNQILINQKVKTKGISNKPDVIEIVMTQLDQSLIQSHHIRIIFNSEFMFEGDPINYRMFHKDIQDALIKLQYTYFGMIKKGNVLIADDNTRFIVDDFQIFLKIQYDRWTMYETFLFAKEMGN